MDPLQHAPVQPKAPGWGMPLNTDAYVGLLLRNIS